MLDLRRLRLLRELHERGTIAAVAEALSYTPSAVSQQLAVLEREAGVDLLERVGRGVRLTDPGLVLVEHAGVLLERLALAEADLAAAAGEVTGRGRIAAFQSVARRLAMPAIGALAERAPRLRCELVEGEPEDMLPALGVGDVDLVLADEWQAQPWRLTASLQRHELLRDPVRLVLPAGHPAAARHAGVIPLAELSGEIWAAGHHDMAWTEMIRSTCSELGGFDADLRHRTLDANLALELARRGLAATMLPDLVLPVDDPALAVRSLAEPDVTRAVYAVTRASDAKRPSVRALLAAVREQVELLPAAA
jgi:DNA-binding transcriptional LysR family regulator